MGFITEFADNTNQGWDGDTGMPGVGLFGDAVQVWSIAQGRDVSIKEAAAAFDVSEEIIREAVEAHPWMLIMGDKIAHDGE